jgi:hypothetical protein
MVRYLVDISAQVYCSPDWPNYLNLSSVKYLEKSDPSEALKSSKLHENCKL